MAKRIAVKRLRRTTGKTTAEKLMRKDQRAEEQLWRQMYLVAEHWISDVDFFSAELEFLSSLVDKHYLSFIDEHNLQKTRSLAAMLSEAEKKNTLLGQGIDLHLKHLSELIQEPFSHNSQEYKDEHQKLESDIADFAKEFRSVKREAFALGKIVLSAEKEKHLLKP